MSIKYSGYAFEVIPEEKNAEIGLFKYSSENDWGVIPAISQFNSVKNEKSNKSGSADNLIKSSLRSAGGETEGIKYQETYNDVNWSIDVYGNLYITGKGEFKPQNPDDGRFYYAPWHKYADEIVNAVVELEDTTDFSQMFYECFHSSLLIGNTQGKILRYVP